MDYINALPDFLAMQRSSFCWFISQGIYEELTLFSKIYNFNKTTEYFLFTDESVFIKPSYNSITARKYGGNYRIKLVVPIEIRDKTIANIFYRQRFSMVTLPLMTIQGTFILNGFERIIIGQIIRSPGIYFEKTKINKKKNKFIRKFSTDITKLYSFLPSGDTFFSEFDLIFPIPEQNLTKVAVKKKFFSNFKTNSIYYYSIQYLKNINTNSAFHFQQHFKYYRYILANLNKLSKEILIKYFLKWLKLTTNLNKKNKKFLIKYFKCLLILLFKHQLLKTLKLSDSICDNKNNLILSQIQIIQLFQVYNKAIVNLQQKNKLKINSKLLFIFTQKSHWFDELKNFQLLKKNIFDINLKLNSLHNFLSFVNFKPTFYFSKSVKDQLKYILEKDSFSAKTNHHKYLKTKTQLINYQKDHKITINSIEKYLEKKYYTAVLIPEHGSWIRIGFQKNLKVNNSKHLIKNVENEIILQLNKTTKTPIISLLKEIGLTDMEISKNLRHADFFYFISPRLINSRKLESPIAHFKLHNRYSKKNSKFLRVFDACYYQLGKIGRLKLNSRLNLQTSIQQQTLTYEDIFAIIDKLIDLSLFETIPDDLDHLKNRRVRSVGELLQNLFRIGFQRLVRKLYNHKDDTEPFFLDFEAINGSLREFFGSSQLSQYLDQTNPLSSLTHRRRISGLGPGGFDSDQVSFAVRDIHPSHYGRICPIETPEGKNVGLVASLTTCARINRFGFLETPYWRVINGKVIKTGNPIYLTAEIEDFYRIATGDISMDSQNYLLKSNIPVRYKQEFITAVPSEVDFIGVSPIQIVSIGASLIPFFEHDDANRALMGSNMQRQSVPLIFPQKAIVGTGLENQIAINSGMALTATCSGIVDSVTATTIIIKNEQKKLITHKLQKYLRSNQQTCINQRPIIWKGEKVKSGQLLTDGPSISRGELALGQNTLIAYMPWHGYNFEDAILINERLIYDDVFSSVHIDQYNIKFEYKSKVLEQPTKEIPDIEFDRIKHLNDDGIVKIGTFVKPGDILVGKIIPIAKSEKLPESKLLRAIFGGKSTSAKDNSYRLLGSESGRVIDSAIFGHQKGFIYEFKKVSVFIAKIRKIQVGDKLAGRHGNKGIVSKILPRQDMPFLPDGTPVDIILNPLGVPSRMNVGQLYECLLGLAGNKLNSRFKILPFDEMHKLEASRILINKKLREASVKRNESWLFNPYAPGKIVLIDGRTGEPFENPVTVGNAYMLKLIHLVEDKMHARATGPYSLITQQPLRGKAHQGGQRFGEMEVWALEGFGVAFTLKELLTVKSDDMEGRNIIVSSIIREQSISKFGIPESFKVLLLELRAIGLDISTYKMEEFSSLKNYETEIDLIEKEKPKSLRKKDSSSLDLNNLLF